jgi:flagellar biosynthetic protein FliO
MPMLFQSLAVFAVLALLFGLLWLARRKGLAALAWRLPGRRGAAERHMRVLERLPLGGQHSLHLVACAGRLLVVAVSPGGCSTVANFAEQPAEASAAAGGAR